MNRGPPGGILHKRLLTSRALTCAGLFHDDWTATQTVNTTTGHNTLGTRRPAPSRAAGERLGGELNVAIARSVVRINRDYAGRGPTKAQAFFRHNVVVVLLQEVMTRLERTLVARGHPDAVRQERRQLQEAMCADLIGAVERLTGCTVTAHMTDTASEENMAVHVFVLDRPVDPAFSPPAAQRTSTTS